MLEHVMTLSMCCCVCRCCRHLCIPCSIIAGILTLSEVVSYKTDPPRLPCHGCRRRSALRASRRTATTMTTPRGSLVFRRCNLFSSSSSSVSSSKNAPLKVGAARPPRNRTRTLPLPRRHLCRCHTLSQHCCLCCPPNPPAQ